ncbi:hypothetical protein V497_00203 [Pseudogymnoascus sp. VKM F-4516 (FW-969)]|nr:hypothetical protein V490_02141 [Pseudogymnoascus sp. VKM F-3557]KFY67791.1 hypothetical protein V497_00203 [Pseudogymnoascus sp. VKM F-4516 (FW-969)]
MKILKVSSFILALPFAIANPVKNGGFEQGEPSDGKLKGGPILGGTNHALDLQNPDNLGRQSTDGGRVKSLKWSFSEGKTNIYNGGWIREQVITDLPQSHDIAGAQLHLKKGALRELHWHTTAEWGYVYAGRFVVSAVDEHGNYTVDTLKEGDIWYFPKGSAHTLQGLDDQNEALVAFDNGDFDALGTTFMVDDWIAHTPRDILAKNFGVDVSVFDDIPDKDPYIFNATSTTSKDSGPDSGLTGPSAYVFHDSATAASVPIPGGGGHIAIVDSKNFPISTTIAAAIVTLKPGALRELHWHPNAEEWLYFHKGTAQATVFIGGGNSRTIDLVAGDVAVFPDNSGHYVLNTSPTEELVWIELYKSERVADISLTQWLALTPPDIVASTLKISREVVDKLKKEKQLLLK